MFALDLVYIYFLFSPKKNVAAFCGRRVLAVIISQEMGIMYRQVEQREGGVCFKNNVSLELIIYYI